MAHRARSVSVEGPALGLLSVQRANHAVRCVVERMQCSSGTLHARGHEGVFDGSHRVRGASHTPWNQKACQESHQVTFRGALVSHPTVVLVRCSDNRKRCSLSEPPRDFGSNSMKPERLSRATCRHYGVLLLSQPTQVVMSKGVTAIAAIRVEEGVLLVADRSCVKDEMLTSTIPAMGPNQVKIESTKHRLHLGIAGVFVSENSDGSVIDLLDIARDAAHTFSQPGEAANSIRQAFDRVAGEVRANRKVGTFDTPAGTIGAITAILLVGLTSSGAEIHEIALTATGRCEQRLVTMNSIAIAPADSLDDFKAAAERASAEATMDDAVHVILKAVARASMTSFGWVSPDADLAAIYANGMSVSVGVDGAANLQSLETP